MRRLTEPQERAILCLYPNWKDPYRPGLVPAALGRAMERRKSQAAKDKIAETRIPVRDGRGFGWLGGTMGMRLQRMGLVYTTRDPRYKDSALQYALTSEGVAAARKIIERKAVRGQAVA